MLYRSLTSGTNRGHGQGFHLGAGEARSLCSACCQTSDDSLKPIMAFMVDVISFGRSDQNSVDLSRNKAGEEPGASLAKTSQNLCKGPFEILNSVRPRIDGLHCIDQNNLAIQLGDVFAKERPDDMGL